MAEMTASEFLGYMQTRADRFARVCAITDAAQALGVKDE